MRRLNRLPILLPVASACLGLMLWAATSVVAESSPNYADDEQANHAAMVAAGLVEPAPAPAEEATPEHSAKQAEVTGESTTELSHAADHGQLALAESHEDAADQAHGHEHPRVEHVHETVEQLTEEFHQQEDVHAKGHDSGDHAADSHGEAHGHDDHGHGGHKEPKGTDIFEADPWPYIFNLSMFLILFAVLTKFVWPTILAGLKAREEKQAHDLTAAERAAAEAKQALEDNKAQLAEARREAQKMIDESRGEAEKLAASLRAQAELEIAQMKDRAAADIRAAKETALTEIYGQTAELSTQIAARILKREINANDQQSLVDESLQELTRRN